MIHYHGLPITPNTAALAAVGGGHAFVSFARPDQLGMAIEVCQSFAVDNGAFSSWRSGEPITDWSRYYELIAELHRYPSFDFAVIPDVVDGDEKANNDLLAAWPWGNSAKTRWIGAPVWHMHESIARLEWLVEDWPRVCIGSSVDFAAVGDSRWWRRMAEAMNAICDKNGNPLAKIHGLRMLNPDIFTRLPFASADSTNIAKNIGIDNKWRGTYTPPSKDVRATVLRLRIESQQSVTFWDKQAVQIGMEL